MTDPITSSDFNYERLSAAIREHLCRAVYHTDIGVGIQRLWVCMKPLPCEDHGR